MSLDKVHDLHHIVITPELRINISGGPLDANNDAKKFCTSNNNPYRLDDQCG